jgi:capsular exopolysaccharide synthesis family protein
MERIKQALERARADRQSALGATTEPAAPASNGDAGGTRQVSAPASATSSIGRADAPVRPLDPQRLRTQRIINGEDDDAVLRTFQLLRTHVLRQLRANQWQTLGVTSPSEGNGKTLTAINLSISLAREVNQTVLLADLDLRRPSVAQVLYGEQLPGVGSYLEGDKELADLLVNPGVERLLILPADRSYPSSSELLTTPKMRALVQALKAGQPAPIVVFDLPPVLAGDDVMAFAPQLDALLLVVEEGRTETDELRRAYELIDEHPILGTVLNKSRDRAASPGYYGYAGGYAPRAA